MKQHLEDDDLILHFYGETGAAAEPHLSDCVDCRARYQALQRVLNIVEAPAVPYRSPEYEGEVWDRLAPKLGKKRRSSWLSPRRWVPVMAAAALLVIAFSRVGTRRIRKSRRWPKPPREFGSVYCW